MNRIEHRDWLAGLAAEDLRRRSEAEPELARKEAVLRSRQADLLATQRASAELEAVLDAVRQDEDARDDG